MARGWTWLAGAALGAGAVYFLDPQAGPRRRTAAVEALTHTLSLPDAGEAVSPPVELPAYGRGLVPEPVDDGVLAERVHGVIRRLVARPEAVRMVVHDSSVYLSGTVLEPEIGLLLVRLRGVPGVWSVESHLATVKPGAPRPGAVGPAPRAMPLVPVAVLAGGLMLTWAMARRGGLPGAVGELLGRSLLATPTARRVLALARPDVTAAAEIEIEASPAAVFGFCTHFSSFPRFLGGVDSVEEDEDGLSYWCARAADGAPLCWCTEVTRLAPHRLLAWRSVPGAPVRHEGEIEMEERGEHRTHVRMRVLWDASLAAAASGDGTPDERLRHDLERLRERLAPARAGAVSGSPGSA